VTVKPQARSAVRGEVSSAPLNPPVNRVFVIRLQEFAGRPATVRVELPVKVRSAARVNLTESQELAKITQLEPLTVDLRPYETATIRIETE
jgi:alpha-mannosidase